jgi:hypothetical protein
MVDPNGVKPDRSRLPNWGRSRVDATGKRKSLSADEARRNDLLQLNRVKL